MNPVQELKNLIQELVGALELGCDKVAPAADRAVSGSITHAFLIKATRSLKAVGLLYANGLEEQAQALIRVLLETWLSFGCFTLMAKRDERDACMRFLDTMMLEKIKQARASDYAGFEMLPDGPTAESLDVAEAEISERYSKEDLRRLRRYGFTGMSAEARAKALDEKDSYDIVYRNFSRNVHSTDYLEHYMLQQGNKSGDLSLYYEVRDVVGLNTALWSAIAIAAIADQVVGCPMQRDLQRLERKRQDIMTRPPRRG